MSTRGPSAPLSRNAGASELQIFGSRVTKVMVAELQSQIVSLTGLNPVVTADVSAVMMRRIEQDEAFDLAVLVDSQIDKLIGEGKLVADSRTDIMRSGIGVAIQRGAPRPDVSTVEALKRTLLAAKSITYLKEGASTIHIERLIKTWGMAEALEPKIIRTTGETVSESVASGQVEIGLIVVPNIMSVAGAEVVAPFPEEIQHWVAFAAAVSAKSRHQMAARRLIDILKAPSTGPIMRTNGLDPM